MLCRIKRNINIIDNSWHCVVGVADPSNGIARLYVDGVLDVSTSMKTSYNLANSRIPTTGTSHL